MPKMPKVAKPIPAPNTPTAASYISSASRGAGALNMPYGAGGGNSVIGSSFSFVGRPSLLGGM